MAAAESFLDARAIHAWYGSSHVLHGVDLHVARGETVGLLGRNGMGKSTLIRAVLGHVREREGRISVAGEDVSRARPHTQFKVADPRLHLLDVTHSCATKNHNRRDNAMLGLDQVGFEQF